MRVLNPAAGAHGKPQILCRCPTGLGHRTREDRSELMRCLPAVVGYCVPNLDGRRKNSQVIRSPSESREWPRRPEVDLGAGDVVLHPVPSDESTAVALKHDGFGVGFCPEAHERRDRRNLGFSEQTAIEQILLECLESRHRLKKCRFVKMIQIRGPQCAGCPRGLAARTHLLQPLYIQDEGPEKAVRISACQVAIPSLGNRSELAYWIDQSRPPSEPSGGLL
jgi:hypothetical protein